MADLYKSLKYVKGSCKDSYGNFQGIERRYFPKWQGWDILDYGGIPSDYSVDEFYREFFWDKLQGDLITSQCLADLLMAFAAVSGKKKAINKLQRVLGTMDVEISDLIESTDIRKINSADTSKVFLGLFAEFVEFYMSIKTPERIKPLLGVYYNYLKGANIDYSV